MKRFKTVVELPTYAISISLTAEIHKNNLKSKSKTSLLAHYSNLFSAPHLGIVFITIVLRYAPKYYQNPVPRYLIYSASQFLYIRRSFIIRIIARINTQCNNKSDN